MVHNCIMEIGFSLSPPGLALCLGADWAAPVCDISSSEMDNSQ